MPEGEVVTVHLRKDSKSVYNDSCDDTRISNPTLTTFQPHNHPKIDNDHENVTNFNSHDTTFDSLDFHCKYPIFSDPKYDFNVKYKQFKSDSDLRVSKKMYFDRSLSENNLKNESVPNLKKISQLYNVTRSFGSIGPISAAIESGSDVLGNVQEMAEIIGNSTVNLNYEEDDDVFVVNQMISSSDIEEYLSKGSVDDLTYGTMKLKKSSTENTHPISVPECGYDLEKTRLDPIYVTNIFGCDPKNIPINSNSQTKNVEASFENTDVITENINCLNNENIESSLVVDGIVPKRCEFQQFSTENLNEETINFHPQNIVHYERSSDKPCESTRIISTKQKTKPTTRNDLFENNAYKRSLEKIIISDLLNSQSPKKPKDNRISSIGNILRNSFRRSSEDKVNISKSKIKTSSFYLQEEKRYPALDPKFYASFDFTFNSPKENKNDINVELIKTERPNSDPDKIVEIMPKIDLKKSKSDTNLCKQYGIENLLLSQCSKDANSNEFGNNTESEFVFQRSLDSRNDFSPIENHGFSVQSCPNLVENNLVPSVKPRTIFFSLNPDLSEKTQETLSKEDIIHDLQLLEDILNSDSENSIHRENYNSEGNDFENIVDKSKSEPNLYFLKKKANVKFDMSDSLSKNFEKLGQNSKSNSAFFTMSTYKNEMESPAVQKICVKNYINLFENVNNSSTDQGTKRRNSGLDCKKPIKNDIKRFSLNTESNNNLIIIDNEEDNDFSDAKENVDTSNINVENQNKTENIISSDSTVVNDDATESDSSSPLEGTQNEANSEKKNQESYIYLNFENDLSNEPWNVLKYNFVGGENVSMKEVAALSEDCKLKFIAFTLQCVA